MAGAGDRSRRVCSASAGLVLLGAVLLIPSAAALAQPSAPQFQDLKLLSLEELMEIDVTTAARRPERVTDVPAAISVVTGEDLRRFGATTLAEALRLAPGLQVARANNRTWAISARGFNITTANKLEVMIDGRSVYSPLLSGVFWDVQDTMLSDIERIEVIRGPGAAVWGANAVNGVINVITRRAADSQGARIVLGTGNQEVALVETRYGGRLGGAGHYRVYGKYNYQDAQTLASGLDARDRFRKQQGGFRMDWDLSPRSAATLQGDLYGGRSRQVDRPDVEVSGGNLLARLAHRSSARAELQAHFYYDRAYRQVPPVFEETLDVYDFDLQQYLRSGRHALVWGAGYRGSRSRTTATPTLLFDPANRTTSLLHAFAEDEFGLLPDRLFVTVGSKFEHNSYTGFEIQPSSSVRVMLPHTQMAWGAVSRAVRMPTRLENDAIVLGPESEVVLRGSARFRSEEVLAYEAGYRVRPRPWLAVDFAAFHSRYDHIRSQELPAPPGPIVLGNTLEATSSGFEVVADVQPAPRLRFRAAYTRLAMDIRRKPGSLDVRGGVPEGNDPDHHFSLRASADLPRNLELDVDLRAVGALPDPPVPAYTEVDVRLGWRPTRRLVLSIIGQNLLHDRHPEFGAPGPQRVDIRRSLYVRLGWGV